MDKRVSSRAIIFYEDSLLAIFRRKLIDGVIKEYYVIPGGGVETGETLEDTVIRELKEEFNVKIKILGYLGKRESENRIDNYFHCEIIDGTPTLGSEELSKMSENNYYEIRKIKIEDIDSTDINAKVQVKNALNRNYISK